MFRYVDAIFRHRLLVLLPLIIVPVLSAIGAMYSGRSYQVNANIWVESAPLLNLNNDYAMRQQPNQVQADTFNEWLGTKSFMSELIQKAGLQEAIIRGEWPQTPVLEEHLTSLPGIGAPLGSLLFRHSTDKDVLLDEAIREVRTAIRVTPVGAHLLKVAYTGDDPQAGVQLINAAIQLVSSRSAVAQVQQTSSTVDFFQTQLKEREKRLADSTDALRRFKDAHPLPLTGIRPGSEDQDLIELERQYNSDRDLYNAVLNRLEEARVAGAAELAKMQSIFKVADSPEAPKVADVRKKTIILFFMVGIVVGLGLGVGTVVSVEWMSRTVRSSEDVTRSTAVPVLATIPHLVPSEKHESAVVEADAVIWYLGSLATNEGSTA